VLFLMYLGIIALWRAFDEPARAARAVSILTLIGTINLPIIKFSVDWWYTLHQPASILRAGGPTIDPSMRPPLYLMALAFLLLYILLMLVRMRTELAHRRAERLLILAADRRGG
jgi:heme exporter protein C